ncbi:MAG: hypothetical protein A3K10_11140 [Bacteroidetes bacterium RIFCSPLOWO2_12_FULL_31_6]|nr:MAG: hypothetical protein A3K10_11140 [Bacteroidetes bacterium RIFCSPLOWO2_12_FULL_31_6]
MKFIKINPSYYILAVLIYIIIFLFSIAVLMSYEDNWNQEMGEMFSFKTMDTYQTIGYLLYTYLLNFPLGFFTWIFQELSYLTIYFFIPNALITTYWIIRVKRIVFNN